MEELKLTPLQQLVRISIINMKKGQRQGQARMNALAEVDKEIHDQISGTDADCFYLDSQVPLFNEVVFPLLQKKEEDPWATSD